MDRNNEIKFDYSNLLAGKDSFLYNFRKGDIYHDPNVEVFLKSKSYKNIWLTSDLHVFKYTYEGTKTSEYYIDIMKRFTKIQKNKVKKNDVFIYLGDISYRHAVEDDEYITMINSFIKQLNGTKILVRGNHDLFNHNYYTEKMGFDFVTDYIQFNNLFLTHAPYPLDPDDNETINIHGHIHGDKKYMNMNPEHHYDVYAFKDNKNITNLQDIIKEVNSEKYIAGELYLDPNWEYFEQAKKMYKDFKESDICCNTDRLIEEISKIKGSNEVEDLLIDNLLKDIEREDFNTPPLLDEYPYFTPDEMEDLGVFCDNPNLNCYDVVYRQEFLDDDDTIDSKAWYNEYKLFCKGIFTEKFENYLPLWRDKVRLLCEKLKHNPSNEIKQSLLELGWNPEVEFTDSNRIKATKRVKSFIESNYDNSNIYNLLEDKEEDDSIIEESYKEKLYPVYIVLSYTDTPFGRVCLKVTKGKYSHSGIALDADLKRIYTFTGDAKYGFAIENLDIYSQNCDDKLSKLGVYCVFVTKEDLRKIKIKLDYFLLNRYDFKYSYLGVLTLLMNKDVTFNNAMICSQFVSFILKSAGINLIGKADSLVQPDDYYKIKDKRIYLLYDGHIKAYDAKKIQKKVDKLAKTAYYVKESTIVTEDYNNNEKNHLYFYHLVPKGTKLGKDGITSLQYQYDNKQYDLFNKNADKYRYRICNGWNVFPDKNPDELTDTEILYGLKQFRGEYGASYIYLFKYIPYKKLGTNMKNILDNKDVYRIDLFDKRVQSLIEDVHWGYYLSNSDNKKMDKNYYMNVTPSEYFSDYNDNNNMIFAAISHIGIKFKNNCIPKELLTKVSIPNTISDVQLDYDKPIKLYHGSHIQNLKYIEARKESRCKYIKDNDKHIFASPNKSFAACFGVKWNDDIARQGSWDHWQHTVMGIDFNKIDIDNSPCSIYELEPNTFKHLHGQEWVSDSTKVKVIKEIKYKSFREMLEKNGVIIISLDQYKKSVEQNRLILSEEKEFGIQFNDNGDLLIKNPKKINYREEYFNSHNLLIEYDKTNNTESIKYELARLWYLNCLLESKLYGKKLSKEDKKEFTIVRAKILNDFKKYIKVVNKVDKEFNFDLYYKQTPFSDKTIKINNSTIKYSFEKMKNVIKLL